MSAAATLPAGTRHFAAPVVLVGMMALATIATLLLSNGNLVAGLAPVGVAALLWAVWVAPLRTSLGITMLLGLAADRPGDTDGFWSSPLAPLGGVLFHNLNHVVSVDALKFSGVFALVGLLLIVRVYRCLIGRAADTPDSLPLAAPMRWAIGLAAVALVALAAFGVVRGGDLQAAKMQTQGYLQLLAVAYLFGVSMRGTIDYRWLGRVVVIGAAIKAVMALWVRATLPAEFPDRWGVMRELEYATNHGDSLVFVCAVAVLLGPLFHQPTRRQLWSFAIMTPLIMAGLIANDRRIAWVQLALVVVAFFLMNPAAPLTRRTARAVVLVSPLLLAYVVVGWSSSARVFGPVSFVRNIVQPERSDGSLDRSTLFRDIENFNLVQTFRPNPVLGTGFGHPFVQAVEGDALTDFVDYEFLPHNSMLGVFAFTGAVGFTALFATLIVGMLLAARAATRADTADAAVAAVAVIGCLASYVVHLWADIGFTEAPTIFLVGLALAIAGQLAVSTGEWRPPAPHRVKSLTYFGSGGAA